ncbi:hypothetical protein MELE44368_12970 [Mycolicibacterium elephantis DSM 44368]|uniref:Uncharacterized protein n=1 Tax=Mycolicibacterium elephantis DSM 44368 TaxID=1335622 RepID=A0A439DXV5_9MYCO|nr:hypothetical protein MELE44368_12970 [Mycolicibacterium elephantis DSM 44368]
MGETTTQQLGALAVVVDGRVQQSAPPQWTGPM